MSELQVGTSTDYDKFKTIEGNRILNASHIKKLKESIEKKNMLAYNPILVSKDFQVIDGQHRLEAARQLQIPIQYMIIPTADLTTIQQLNSNLRSWATEDFVQSYARLGKSDYVRLLKFADDFDFPLVLSAELLMGKGMHGGGGEGRISAGVHLRDGTFQIRNENNAMRLMQSLRELQPFCDAKVWKVPAFIRMLVRLYRLNMDHKTLVEQLRKTGVRLRRQASAREYMFQIVEAYNHGLKKNRLNPILALDTDELA